MTQYVPKTRPFPHQVRMSVLAAKAKKGRALYADPGTGKTKAMLDALGMLYQAGRGNRCFVVCPIAALPVWEDELHFHFPFRAIFRSCLDPAVVIPGNSDHRKNFVVWAMNYDLFRYRRRGRGGKWIYPYAKLVERWGPDYVVMDESHRAKRAGSVTATTLWRSVERQRRRKTVRVFPLSGTPSPKGYQDIFAQYRVMDSEIFGTAKADFEETYCQYGQQPWNKFKVIRYLNKAELLRKIHANAVVVPESVLDLPPRLFQNVRVKLPPKARRVYEDLVADLVAVLKGGEEIEASTAAVLRLRLQQVTGGFTTDGVFIHDAKLRILKDILEDLFAQEEPVVLYARFLPEIDAVADLTSDLKYRTNVITGATHKTDRAKYVRSFQASKTPAALVMQVQTGSLAWTLHRAKEVVYYSLPDAWDLYYQGIKRVHRLGQGRAVRVRHLVGEGTIDPSQLRSLRGKANIQAELTRNPVGYLHGI